ncbi:hypothetical protein ACA910_021102 [Epithemia clementina (nom. ined.)]
MSALEDLHNKYDPNVVIRAAQDKLNENNDFEGGQMIFQSALLTWVDDAREISQNSNNGNIDYDTMQQAIVTLWLAYAEFLSSVHQFKSAMEAYEQAVSCPVAGHVGTVWLTYAQFAQERGKKRTAQQLYIRALLGSNGNDGSVQEEQDRDILWQAFLEMMQADNPDLTLTSLQQAVISEQQEKQNLEQSTAATSSVLSIAEPDSVEMNDEPASKRMKLANAQKDQAAHGITSQTTSPELQKIHVVSLEAVEIEAKAFLEVLQHNELPPDVLAAWMIRDGQSLPQAPEPPLFEPTPPKFLDPTAKDILGVDLALNLNRRLRSTSGTVVLKVSQALWMLTALTEHHASEAVAQLDQSLKHAHEQREANFAYRIATATTESIVAAVRANIEHDRQAFQQACQDQRQKLLQDIAWQMRRMLCVQQQILTQLQVPGFSGPGVDADALQEQSKICSYLHAAFFLRNRIGPEPHLALLNAQAKRLEEQQKQQQLEAQSSPSKQTSTPLHQPQSAVQGIYPGQPPNSYPSYPSHHPLPSQPLQAYGIPPPPPPPPSIPAYPVYVPHPQHGMMPQQQNGPQQHVMQQQQRRQPPSYGNGAPFNYYPS